MGVGTELGLGWGRPRAFVPKAGVLSEGGVETIKVALTHIYVIVGISDAFIFLSFCFCFLS